MFVFQLNIYRNVYSMGRKSRNGKKKQQRKSNKLVITRLPNGLPSVYVCKLDYVDFITMNPTLIGVDYFYRANSAFDPDYSSTGHQPMGYDRLAAAYRHYTVVGSKISISGSAQSNGTVPAWLTLATADDAVASNSSLRNIIENGAQARRIAPQSTSTATINSFYGKGNQEVMHAYYSQAKSLNKKLRGQYAMSAAVGANPIEVSWFRITAIRPDNLSIDPSPITVQVRMSLSVKFFEGLRTEAEN